MKIKPLSLKEKKALAQTSKLNLKKICKKSEAITRNGNIFFENQSCFRLKRNIALLAKF